MIVCGCLVIKYRAVRFMKVGRRPQSREFVDLTKGGGGVMSMRSDMGLVVNLEEKESLMMKLNQDSVWG